MLGKQAEKEKPLSKPDPVPATLIIEFENEGIVTVRRIPLPADEQGYMDTHQYEFEADDLTYSQEEIGQLLDIIRAFTSN